LVDLPELVKSVLNQLAPELTRFEASINTDFQTDLRRVVADRVALEQVLINLITNALQAMTGLSVEFRSVHISAVSINRDFVCLSVSDGGPGISPAAMPRLFEPYFTTTEGGMGLGLSIARAALESNGGTLTARTDLNGGAVFECFIPGEPIESS
jgi:C4-dicarboxylate-specific signal transduction histidine kinase